MSVSEAARPAAYAQFSTALRFSLRNQTRNRMAALLLVAFVPLWYLFLRVLVAGEKPVSFKLYATGELLTVDTVNISLITAGLNALTMIMGFAVFDAVREARGFDRRLISSGYRPAGLIGAKALSVALISAAVSGYAAVVLLLFWRPAPGGWAAILAGFTVMSLIYGALGLLLGVLVKNDLEGFFVIIMGGQMDTFLQNPEGNPLANSPVLQWFPSFGPTQFAVGGAFGDTAHWSHLGLGLIWAAIFAGAGLLIRRRADR